MALSRVCSDLPACARDLEGALRDPDSQVRTKAAEGLERLGEVAGAASPLSWERSATTRRGCEWPRCVPWPVSAGHRPWPRRLCDRALSDQEEMVRQAAERALAEVSGPSSGR